MLDVVVRFDPPGTAWVSLRGELDLAYRDQVEQRLEELASAPETRLVMLDVRGLEFMDVTSLAPLLRIDARMAASGRRIVLVREEDDAVARLLEASCLHRHLEWVADPADLERPGHLAGPRHLRRRGGNGGEPAHA